MRCWLRVLTGVVLWGGSLLAATSRPLVVGYAPNWRNPAELASSIDFSKLTHLNLAFENPVDDSGRLSFHEGEKQLIDKAQKSGVKVLVSIGGGSVSEDAAMRGRYNALLASDKRAAFVRELGAYVETHHLDGIDVDLEGPAIGPDYGAFIDDLAAELHRRGKLITAALGSYGGDRVPDAALAKLDLIHVMAYDATGPWNLKKPGPHSTLEFAKRSVDSWLKRGVPPARLVLGVPFYGYAFGATATKREYSYADIVAEFPGAEDKDLIGDAIHYNGAPTIRAKASYAMEQKLAGIMIWSLDSDAAGSKSLLTVIHQTLNP